ncbi:putative quinol monooxygenase [Emticicia sp. BO119]|uniref:putative quinol monooxygenase n=1 Tax=Emticicia sp. BO119 TaxID=2757768 RepID=UPI001E657E96|nr:putative quinol monooxygenase [Emticicia sp. BO119]
MKHFIRNFPTMRYKIIFLFILTSLMILSFKPSVAQQKDMMIRIAEIEIIPEYLEEYKAILKEESSASVKIEPGVIVIFPMYQKENPNQIRLLEIYANREAYEAHLKTPHFQHYKSTTLKMVKSLKLIEMSAIDPETMQEIFRKIK